ncbi:hypothetical protein FRC20_003768 [Serendipita sp. 405]|nr:hypothetical protein FRC20_003768 [Serendipita sp. 405]
MRLLPVFFVLETLIVSPALLVNAAGTMFVRPQIRVTTTFADFDARIMDHWGGGGGKFVKISKDAEHPFQGRTFGGAKRKEIGGTRAFGSGYPYGGGNQSTVAGRPFPFGTWPLYWDQNFMNSSEYGPQYDAIRPGGLVMHVPLRTNPSHFNVTDSEVYYAIGDRDSLLLVMISYVTWCHVTPAWPSKFDPTLPNSTVKLENVVQYFRASSFALASPAYNNTFARISNSDTMDSTPLPEFMEYSPFRECIDHVTRSALAIMNKPPDITVVTNVIIVFTSAGWIILGAAVCILVGIFYLMRSIKKFLWSGPFLYLSKLWDRYFPDPEIKRREMQVIREARRRETTYENYP